MGFNTQRKRGGQGRKKTSAFGVRDRIVDRVRKAWVEERGRREECSQQPVSVAQLCRRAQHYQV